MKTIIFDFDGTIADSFLTLLGAFGEITGREQKLTPAEVEDLRSKSLKGIMAYLKIKKWQIPRLVIKARKVLAAKITDIKPFEGLPAVVKKLHQDGYQMFVLSSNSSANINKFLRANGMDAYFTKIYGDIGLRSKAFALKKLLKKEHVALDNSIYIGDEVRDIEAAKKINIPVISVSWGYNNPKTLKNAKPSALAARPQDLPAIVNKLK